MIQFFNWIVDNNLFGKVELAALVHDEAVVMFPEEHMEVPDMLKKCMEESAAKYCKKLPIPAEPSVDECWRH